MSRMSTGRISEAADRRAVMLLSELLRSRREAKALPSLLRHLLTKRERAELVKRLEVATRLRAGQSYRMIQDEGRAGPTLIRRVDRWLTAERPHYRRLFSIRHRRRARAAPILARERDQSLFSFDEAFKRFFLWNQL